MDTEELRPNLIQLSFPVGQAYLWRDGAEGTLIDTGLTGYGERVRQVVAGEGITLRRIVLTHWHGDHAGSAAEIAGWSGAEVIAHRADAPVIRGLAEGAGPVFQGEWERELHATISPGVPGAPPCRVDQEVSGGEVLSFGGGARVVPMPGHTEGSIAVWVPGVALFTGDAVANVGELGVGVFNVDSAQAARSVLSLRELDFELACFGHGPALRERAADRFRELAATLTG